MFYQKKNNLIERNIIKFQFIRIKALKINKKQEVSSFFAPVFQFF